jgi:hypothetical protein
MFKIEPSETLLFVTEYTGDRIYIGETDFFDRPWTEPRLIAELSGADVVRVLKLDLGTLKTVEVTELCAKIWIEDMEAKCLEIDPDNMPQFVADSRAWAEQDLTAPVEEYGTLDARTQGLVRGALL